MNLGLRNSFQYNENICYIHMKQRQNFKKHYFPLISHLHVRQIYISTICLTYHCCHWQRRKLNFFGQDVGIARCLKIRKSLRKPQQIVQKNRPKIKGETKISPLIQFRPNVTFSSIKFPLNQQLGIYIYAYIYTPNMHIRGKMYKMHNRAKHHNS